MPVDDGTYDVVTICPSCLPGYPCLVCYNEYIPESGTADGIIDYYTAVVLTANDYYLFGMGMPGRSYSADGAYRYGFNGKENDNEVKGEGNQQDYGMRIYDPRLGRFLSVDPIAGQYPELTTYQFASNTPIRAVDIDGLEAGVISFGYRVTAIFVTGSISIGAVVDYKGNVKVYTQWSAGVGTGAYAGGGASLSVYPTATSDQVMGSAINVGGNIGIPGVSFGIDLNVSLQQDDQGIEEKVNGVKLGVSGGIKPGSIGPGGVEVHIDYSSATPEFEFNLFEMARSEIARKLQKVVDATWFLSMSETEIDNLIDYLFKTQEFLKKALGKPDPNASPTPPLTPGPPNLTPSTPPLTSPVSPLPDGSKKTNTTNSSKNGKKGASSSPLGQPSTSQNTDTSNSKPKKAF